MLFLDAHGNGCSQIAASLLRHRWPNEFAADCAGLEPKAIDFFAIQVMREMGIDVSQERPTAIADLKGAISDYDAVFTMIPRRRVFQALPGVRDLRHWGFPDWSMSGGSDREMLAATRTVRDQIQWTIDNWRNTLLGGASQKDHFGLQIALSEPMFTGNP